MFIEAKMILFYVFASIKASKLTINRAELNPFHEQRQRSRQQKFCRDVASQTPHNNNNTTHAF